MFLFLSTIHRETTELNAFKNPKRNQLHLRRACLKIASLFRVE